MSKFDEHAGDDQPVMGWTSPSSTTMVIMNSGRIFERIRDPKHFNDGRPNNDKWIWREIDGPLAAP